MITKMMQLKDVKATLEHRIKVKGKWHDVHGVFFDRRTKPMTIHVDGSNGRLLSGPRHLLVEVKAHE